jgi:hypothetical protein
MLIPARNLPARLPAALLAAPGLLLSLVPAAPPEPAAAAPRRIPRVVGAYYGGYTARNGGFTPGGVNITEQSGRRITGRLLAGGGVPGAPFTGTVTASGAIRITGRGRTPRGTVKLTLTGTCTVVDEDRHAVMDGEYRMNGAVAQRGTFSFNGTLR